MQIQRAVPPALTGLVDSMVGYAHTLEPQAVHFGVANPGVTVVISFDEPLDVGWAGSESHNKRWLLASGLHTRPALIRTHGLQHGIMLSLTPAGSRVLLGQPASSLTHAFADHSDVSLGVPDHLHEQLAEASWPRRFQLLEGHLCRLARASRVPVADDLRHAWHLIERSRGRIRVDALAAEVGWSRRHLTTRFRDEFGLTPKEVARLHRFEYAQQLARQALPWGAVAAGAGYADQAHLARDFRAFSGQTPTDWRAEVFPILQD